MFRKLRIAILLIILIFVAANTWLDRVYSTDWNGALQVALYPVNADGSNVASDFIEQLSSSELQRLEDFFSQQAQYHGLSLQRPLRFSLAPALVAVPPTVPEDAGRLGVMLWSLKLRWFTWKLTDPAGPTPTIRLFMLYHDPANASVLPHSVGLQKGLVGIAHVFAAKDMAHANQVIVAHELLHTLGATDKYDLQTNLPLYSDGYADPQKTPSLPQTLAELMAGRIAVSETHAEQANSLSDCVIGDLTAREIGWTKAQ
ncbi:MAG: hypothetical protein AB7Q04_10060 [Steroidobacteraceae bacterium]